MEPRTEDWTAVHYGRRGRSRNQKQARFGIKPRTEGWTTVHCGKRGRSRNQRCCNPEAKAHGKNNKERSKDRGTRDDPRVERAFPIPPTRGGRYFYPTPFPNSPGPPRVYSSRPRPRPSISYLPERTFQQQKTRKKPKQNQQQPQDYGFGQTTRKLYALIRTLHHLQKANTKLDDPESPLTISKMVEHLATMIKPALPNPTTLQRIVDNAKNWGQNTLTILEDHYKTELQKQRTMWTQELPKNWKESFEVATNWAHKNLPKIKQNVINQAENTIINCKQTQENTKRQQQKQQTNRGNQQNRPPSQSSQTEKGNTQQPTQSMPTLQEEIETVIQTNLKHRTEEKNTKSQMKEQRKTPETQRPQLRPRQIESKTIGTQPKMPTLMPRQIRKIYSPPEDNSLSNSETEGEFLREKGREDKDKTQGENSLERTGKQNHPMGTNPKSKELESKQKIIRFPNSESEEENDPLEKTREQRDSTKTNQSSESTPVSDSGTDEEDSLKETEDEDSLEKTKEQSYPTGTVEEDPLEESREESTSEKPNHITHPHPENYPRLNSERKEDNLLEKRKKWYYSAGTQTTTPTPKSEPNKNTYPNPGRDPSPDLEEKKLNSLEKEKEQNYPSGTRPKRPSFKPKRKSRRDTHTLPKYNKKETYHNMKPQQHHSQFEAHWQELEDQGYYVNYDQSQQYDHFDQDGHYSDRDYYFDQFDRYGRRDHYDHDDRYDHDDNYEVSDHYEEYDYNRQEYYDDLHYYKY